MQKANTELVRVEIEVKKLMESIDIELWQKIKRTK